MKPRLPIFPPCELFMCLRLSHNSSTYPQHRRFQTPHKMPKHDKPSGVFDPADIELAHSRTSRNSSNLPDYWSAPGLPGPEAERPNSGCQRKGGIHVSRLHYFSLCAAIIFLLVTIVSWTAVELHRQSPPPVIKFAPQIILGPLHTGTIASLVVPSSSSSSVTELPSASTVTVVVTPSPVIFSSIVFSTTTLPNTPVNSNSSMFMLSQSFLDPTDVQIDNARNEEPGKTVTETVTPTKPPVVPSTLYFRPTATESSK